MLKLMICGQMHSGKTTVAEHLVKKYKNAQIFSLASRLKRLLKILDVDKEAAFEYAIQVVCDPLVRESSVDISKLGLLVNSLLEDTLKIENEPVKPRKRLRFLGTEGFRSQLDPNIWIYNMLDEVNLRQNTTNQKLAVAITDDVRFLNEFSMLIDQGYLPIVLEVSGEVQNKRHQELGYPPMVEADSNHASEASVKEIIKKLKAGQLTDCIFNADLPLNEMLEQIDEFVEAFRKEENLKNDIIDAEEVE